jgi:hypothetical protein
MQRSERRLRLTPVIRTLFVSAFAAGLWAQTPTVGDINLYGLRKLPPEKVLGTLGLKPGDKLPGSKGDLEDRLEELPGVVLARVTAVCCDGPSALLFAGIEEKGAPHFALRSEPSGTAVLPDTLIQTYRRFLEAVENAVRDGNAAEDLTRGHSLMAYPGARAVQQEFAVFAGDHLAELRDVLRNGSDAEQRAIAATVIGYATRKGDVVDDLQYAMQDPDEAVRANAMRSLTAVAVLAARDPDQEIKIAPTWFVEMLNSVVLSDRLKASEALVTLTEARKPDVLQFVRERAMPSLVEMARWKSLRYALPAYVLVGRIGGLSEDEIHARWEKGERESVVEQATARGKKK